MLKYDALLAHPSTSTYYSLYNMTAYSFRCTNHNPITYVILVLFLESLMLLNFLGAQS